MEAWNDKRIDDRRKEDIMDEIERLARSYTPEWKFTKNHPDAGSVIGMIFAGQTIDNIRHINLMLEKYHTEFANMYGISLKAAHPASTIAVLTASDTIVSGTPFYKGTQITGENEKGEEVIFEAMHDLYVTSAKLTEILAVSAKEQKIIPYRGKFYRQDLLTGEHEQIEERTGEDGFVLFSYQEDGIGQQALLLYHRFLFDSPADTIQLKFYGEDGTANISAVFGDTKKYQFFIYTESGLEPVDSVSAAKDAVLLRSGKERAKIAYGEAEYAVLVIQQTGTEKEAVVLTEIEIATETVETVPDFIYDGNKELSAKRFLPFGEQPVLYDECYIGKSDWMEQPGFVITMQFHLEFASFQESGRRSQEQNLRIIKKRPQTEGEAVVYDSFVQDIELEYFNGRGWKKLECSLSMEALFASEENAGKYSVSFVVPADAQTTIQGGHEQKCIRMQVKRADNCYMAGVIYTYPIISNLRLQIKSSGEKVHPDLVEYVDGIRRESLMERLGHQEKVKIFDKIPYGGEYLYLGFDRRMESGPVSIFWKLKERLNLQGLHMEYSYSSEKGFLPLRVRDDTHNFENQGRVLFMPPIDFAKCSIEGVERYWIRIEQKGNAAEGQEREHPFIENIYMNAVEIQNIETGLEHDYFIDVASAGMSFPLYADNILRADVWVNEKEQLSNREMSELLQTEPERVRAEYNFLGEMEDFYVKWEEVENFEDTRDQVRVYVLDRGADRICFGDGVHVRIPQNTRSVAFKVQVTRCSGKSGNLRAGEIGNFRGNLLSMETVENPIHASGGNDLESLTDALARGSNLLSARRRLVSEQDYIRETELFSREIEQVACITGVDIDGTMREGTINLVILLKEYRQGARAFQNLEKELKEHMLRHCELTCRKEELKIVEPVFVKISVRIWLAVKNMAESLEIREHWLEYITDYLEPVRSVRHGGWKFGVLPRESQIKMMLNALGTDAVMKRFSISAVYQDYSGVHEKSLDSIRVSPYMICCSGEHQITINEQME